MTYATQQNMIDRFGELEIKQLTDRSSIGNIDAAVLTKAFEDTDAEINSYLESRYALPLVSTPLIITRLACDIARYYLYDIRATELVKQRYEDAVKFLINVSKGVVSLGVDSNNQAQPATGGTIKSVANDRVFSSSALSDY